MRLRPTLILGSMVWLSLILAAPILKAYQHGSAFLFYTLFQPACHQIAERSFFLMGAPLAVCQRCFGLYLGFCVVLACSRLLELLQNRASMHSKGLLLFALPMAADVLLTDLNSAASRFATGSLAAVPLAFLLWNLSREADQPMDQVSG